MAKNVIKKDRTTTVDVTEPDSQWVIDKKATLTGEPGLRALDVDGVSVDVRGKIVTDAEGILIYSTVEGATSDDTEVTIAKTGRVTTAHHGIFMEGNAVTLDNAGIVNSAQGYGVHIIGDGVEIDNDGKILADTDHAVVLDGTLFLQLTNSGVIATKGDTAAIEGKGVTMGSITNEAGGKIGVINFAAGSGAITIINNGSIAADVGVIPKGIGFGDASDSLINRGKIGGDVYFGDGDDTGDFRKGTIGGHIILGGDGDDTFIIDDAATKIYEFSADGADVIKTTVSFTLGNLITDRIESLVAIGKKKVDLTGNDQDNSIFGNDKSNHLVGGGGEDFLSGKGGNDLLDGGTGEDHFAFGANSGVDTIEGFELGVDMILLSLIPGIDNFGDLDGRITDSDQGDFAIIDLGDGNRIRLAGIEAGDLKSTDFSIIGDIVLP